MYERKRKSPAAWNYFNSAHKRWGYNVFLVFRCKCFPSSHSFTLFLFTSFVACLSSFTLWLLHGELSSELQCFLARRRIPKGTAPRFQLVTLGVCLTETRLFAGKRGLPRLMARKTGSARSVIWRLLLLRLHLCIYIPFHRDNRFCNFGIHFLSLPRHLLPSKYELFKPFDFFFHRLCTYFHCHKNRVVKVAILADIYFMIIHCYGCSSASFGVRCLSFQPEVKWVGTSEHKCLCLCESL